MERLQAVACHSSAPADPSFHPLDPLSGAEIDKIVSIIKSAFSDKEISFNTVTLTEPSKADFDKWSADKSKIPERLAYFVVLAKGQEGIMEGSVSLDQGIILSWKLTKGVMPILTVEDLNAVEDVIRKDPRVIEQCVLSGVPASDMHKVYCDPWTIGYDERYGTSRRLQQALMYYRSHEDDSQYSHPLDFCPLVDTEKLEVVFIDIPEVRRPLSKHPHANFNPEDIAKQGGYRTNIKPIATSQPEGVSYKKTGRVIEWQNWSLHVGFNYREGIVLSDIKYNDHGEERKLFHRLSLVEMVVPYGNPDFPHIRKHAFDLGEYGAGYMANSLGPADCIGNNCKNGNGFLDAEFVTRNGDVEKVPRVVCIRESLGNSSLFKHSDFRDSFKTTVITRGTQLNISQIFTAANYEYMVYYIFMQDGTIQLEVKLTGILNTYVCNPGEDLRGYGTQVYPGVNAHNHQHLFSLRIHPNIDGPNNSVAMVDAKPSPLPVGHPDNMYGNAFGPERTVFKTSKQSQTQYDGYTSRTWDFFNPNKLNPYSGKPVSYKLVSRECPPLLPKEGSLVWKRAGFARYHMQVVPLSADKFYPAGQHVPQTSGEPSRGITEWIGDGSANVDNTEVVAYHTFGLTHFPAPEDFPVMPAEPIVLLLRPRNFFTQNPALDVPPRLLQTTTGVKSGAKPFTTGDLCT